MCELSADLGEPMAFIQRAQFKQQLLPIADTLALGRIQKRKDIDLRQMQ